MPEEQLQDAEMEEAEKSKESWVKIISNDNFTFIVKRSVAEKSGMLGSMLNSNFVEGESSTCPINERGAVVEKVLEYLTYKKIYENAAVREDIPDFKERVVPEVALELLMAADYLDT